MGRIKGPYNEEYSVGEKVQIANRDVLEKFIQDWKYHNPLQHNQLNYAGRISTVAKVGFYHGGDELYSFGRYSRYLARR